MTNDGQPNNQNGYYLMKPTSCYTQREYSQLHRYIFFAICINSMSKSKYIALPKNDNTHILTIVFKRNKHFFLFV